MPNVFFFMILLLNYVIGFMHNNCCFIVNLESSPKSGSSWKFNSNKCLQTPSLMLLSFFLLVIHTTLGCLFTDKRKFVYEEG